MTVHSARIKTAFAVIAALAVTVYFWRFTHVSLRTGFSQDDLMNLFFAWRVPFSEILKANLFFRTEVVRPLGALFYASFLDVFGFDGLPLRVFCYTVLWCNVVLTYLVVERVTRSREIASLATFLHCYQPNYFPLYYGSGSCYDVFAFFFFYSAFLSFLRGFNPWVVAILYSCAVNSKEAAVSLPAILLVFQLLRNPPRSVSWIWREARAVLATGGVGLIYLWARFTSPNNLLGHPAYTPAFSVYRYLESTAYYLNELSSQEHLWTTTGAAVLLLSMAAIALLARSRDLWFAWLLIVVGSAPIAFVLPRGVAAYYIPLVGYALFIAIVLVRTREFLFRARSAALALSFTRRTLRNAVRDCLALANSSSAPISGLLEGARGNRFDGHPVPQSPGMVPSGRPGADCQRPVSRIRMGLDLYRDLDRERQVSEHPFPREA